MPEQTSTDLQTPATPNPKPTPDEQMTSVTGSGVGILTASTEFSVDTYADSLMDELFQDLEQSLERGALPDQPVQPEATSTVSSTLSSLLLSPFMPRQGEGLQPIQEDHHLASAPDAEESHREQCEGEVSFFDAISEAEQATSSNKHPWGVGKSLDRLLLVVIAASLTVTGAFWLVLRQTGTQLLAPVAAPGPAAETATEVPVSPEDAEFLAYVQRSLNAIDRRSELDRQVASATDGDGDADLPTVTVPGSPVASNQGDVERVYIPVYQAPQTTPAMPPTTTTPSATAAAPTTPGSIPNISPSASHVLVGLLELGERSAALFEINDTVRRVYVGESIGNSGWTLVSVSNEEAIVRRNGEVRSIYIGQRF
jgi:hypothetical protein